MATKKSGKAAVKAKRKTNKPVAKATAQPAAQTPAGPRRLKLGTYRTLRLQKRIKHPAKLPNVWKLTRVAARMLWRHKRLFTGITLVYGLLNLALAHGISGGTDVSALKHNLDQALSGDLKFLTSSLSIFVVLVGSAGNTTDQTAGAYQVFLAIIGSLAMIWALRQTLSGSVPRVRDAYYRGMYPLVPFLLVLLVIGLQLLPLAIGSALYGIVINNSIAVYTVERILWGGLFLGLVLLSFYMLSSSLFALYIVTLPDMTPMKALRSARELVRYRRWTVLRKVLCLPVILLIAAAVIMLPIIAVVPVLAQWVFFILTMFSLLATHGYMYTLYRELLHE